MIIISGNFKGKKILTESQVEYRPTMSKVREAMFSILENIPDFDIEGASVLDLYCGSGVLSFESLSRGASESVLMDNSPAQLSIARKNAENLGVEARVKFVRINASLLPRANKKFDLIFIDPPYNENLVIPTIERLNEYDWINDKTIIVIETESNFQGDFPRIFSIIHTRIYSRAKLTFLKKTK